MLHKNNLDNAVVDFLAESSCAFRVVDLPSFKEMFKIANSKITIKSREFYSKLVSKHANEVLEDLHLSQSYFHHYRVDHGILHSLCQALS